MSVSGGPDIVENGLVLCLDAGNTKSYPGSGTVWTDLSRSGNNGTLTNGPAFSSNSGGAIIFAGDNDYALITTNAGLNFINNLSLSSWFNISVLPGATEIAFIRKNDQWQLGLSNSSTIRCLIQTSGTSGWTAANDVAYTFATNTWYNMAMTYNGTNMLIYVNGVLVKNAVVTGTISATNNDVNIGRVPHIPSYLNGSISNCQIYNTALTQNQILQNYNATKGRFRL